jgi:hypothetical protein
MTGIINFNNATYSITLNALLFSTKASGILLHPASFKENFIFLFSCLKSKVTMFIYSSATPQFSHLSLAAMPVMLPHSSVTEMLFEFAALYPKSFALQSIILFRKTYIQELK